MNVTLRDAGAAAPGDWAELALVVLEPGDRAPALPDDTAATPLAARVKGFLESADRQSASAGGRRTLAGRRVEGTPACRPDPRSRHSFGKPVPELLPSAGAARAARRGRSRDA